MKTFVKENWYKLMIGCSMFIFSISALIYSVSPVRANIPQVVQGNKVNPSSSFSFYVVKNNVIYGLRNGESGSYANHWAKCGL